MAERREMHYDVYDVNGKFVRSFDDDEAAAERFADRNAGHYVQKRANDPRADALRTIVEEIEEYESQTEADEHTDVGDAWDVFHRIRDVAVEGLSERHGDSHEPGTRGEK